MTVVMMSTAPDRDEYDRVSKFVNISGDRPAGLILHAAAELPTGEVQISSMCGTLRSRFRRSPSSE